MDIRNYDSVSLGAALAPLAFLDEERYQSFREAVSSDRRFLIPRATAKAVAKSAELPVNDVLTLLSALNYLQDRFQRGNDEAGFEREKSVIIPVFNEEDGVIPSAEVRALLVDRLSTVITYSKNYSVFAKGNRLSRGFLPNLVGFSTFVDLRASFEDGGSEDAEDVGEIVGYVPVIQCRVSVRDSSNKRNTHVFQIEEGSIDEIINALVRAKVKTSALKEVATKLAQVI